MLTREIRRITLYAETIGDHAVGLAAQQAVSDDGSDADRSDPTTHTVLRELRKGGIAHAHGHEASGG